MPRPRYALKTFVHRILVLRLLGAGAMVALAFGTMAYVRDQQRITEAVQQSARSGIERMRLEVRSLLGTQSLDLAGAVQSVLDAEMAPVPDRGHGEFVYVRFLDTQGARLGERMKPVDADADAATLRQAIDAAPQRSGGNDNRPPERVDIAGHAHLHMTLPVHGRNDRVVAHAEGLFRLSDRARADMRRAALETALYVSLIVLATALLLYPVIFTLMRRLAGYSEQLLAANLETLEVLGSAIAKRDSDTDAHNFRVTLYALRLAEAAGLDTDRQRALVKGAFLHDVGKIGIPDRILLKPARLDSDEVRTMQLHVDHGLDIVRRSRWLTDARDVIGSHHEKFDGSGYPQRTAGAAIPTEARIFAIADVFDALTSRRPYKEPLSFDEAMRILEAGRGKHFDPALLDHFGRFARELHERHAGRDDDALRDELRTIVSPLFVGGLDSLRY
jgi:HD-GYP domain-containing protein (c-di-GMP phosphodiesterase class II)